MTSQSLNHRYAPISTSFPPNIQMRTVYKECTHKEKAVYEEELQVLRATHRKTVTLLEGLGKKEKYESASELYLVEKSLRFLDDNSYDKPSLGKAGKRLESASKALQKSKDTDLKDKVDKLLQAYQKYQKQQATAVEKVKLSIDKLDLALGETQEIGKKTQEISKKLKNAESLLKDTKAVLDDSKKNSTPNKEETDSSDALNKAAAGVLKSATVLVEAINSFVEEDKYRISATTDYTLVKEAGKALKKVLEKRPGHQRRREISCLPIFSLNHINDLDKNRNGNNQSPGHTIHNIVYVRELLEGIYKKYSYLYSKKQNNHKG